MKVKWTRIFINPFEDFSSNQLLIVGLVTYVLSSMLVYYTGNHFQGVISIKQGASSNLIWSFYNNGMVVVLLSVLCYLFGKIRRSNVRFVDVLNVVLISRIIIYVILLLLIEPVFVKNTLTKVELAVLDDDFMLTSLSNLDRTVLISLAMISLLGLFYFFYFFVTSLCFVLNSKSKIDVLWILVLVFGLEILFSLFHLNIY